VRRRLGLGPINGRQLVEGLVWIAFLFVVQVLGQIAWELLDPQTVAQVEEISSALYADYDTVWEWVALAVGAGVGEEILFRGALQPVLGIWFTSFFFALIHVQYGILTPATLVLFILAFSLGIIRRRHNTTLAIFVHFGYNLTLGLISFYLGV
jgi:membrane protease YdiL (CAAX protease family)